MRRVALPAASAKRSGPIALLLCLIVSVVVLTAPAEVQAQQFPLGPNHYTHNICGALGCGGYASGSPPGSGFDLTGLKVVIYYSSTIPVAVAIQESCGLQALDLLLWLRAWKWPAFHAAGHPQLVGADGSFACNGTGPFGTWVYVIGTSATTPVPSQTGGYVSQAPGDEDRGYACADGTIAGQIYVGCTTHMTNDSDTIAGLQFSQHRLHIEARAYGGFPKPVVWGGDLNLEPNQLPVGFTYSLHYEADRCAGTLARHTIANAKIDYAFRSGPNRACAADAVLTPAISGLWPNGYSSDHVIYGGWWQ